MVTNHLLTGMILQVAGYEGNLFHPDAPNHRNKNPKKRRREDKKTGGKMERIQLFGISGTFTINNTKPIARRNLGPLLKV